MIGYKFYIPRSKDKILDIKMEVTYKLSELFPATNDSKF